VRGREVQQARRAGHGCGDPTIGTYVSGTADWAATSSARTQQDVVLLDHAHAKEIRINAGKGERQHFAIAGKTPGTSRR
jgi:hypothetical protein